MKQYIIPATLLFIASNVIAGEWTKEGDFCKHNPASIGEAIGWEIPLTTKIREIEFTQAEPENISRISIAGYIGGAAKLHIYFTHQDALIYFVKRLETLKRKIQSIYSDYTTLSLTVTLNCLQERDTQNFLMRLSEFKDMPSNVTNYMYDLLINHFADQEWVKKPSTSCNIL